MIKTNIYIPSWIKKFPDNLVELMVGRRGNYRFQRIMSKDVKKQWEVLADKYFDERSSHGLPVTGQFRSCLRSKNTKRKVEFYTEPCINPNDGFDYRASLMYGRDPIEGRTYNYILDKSTRGGRTEGTTSSNFDAMMAQLREFTRSRINREKWSKKAMRGAKRDLKRYG